jgi:hypothetical protein
LPLVGKDIRPNQTEFWRQKSTKLGAKSATRGAKSARGLKRYEGVFINAVGI